MASFDQPRVPPTRACCPLVLAADGEAKFGRGPGQKGKGGLGRKKEKENWAGPRDGGKKRKGAGRAKARSGPTRPPKGPLFKNKNNIYFNYVFEEKKKLGVNNFKIILPFYKRPIVNIYSITSYMKYNHL